jgi:parallel beta-helix repeat protein
MKIMKDGFAVLILLLILTGALAPFIPTRVFCSPKYWHVDPWGLPYGEFTSIQEAIANQSVEDGDYIIVNEGTYYESLYVNKSLKIWGSRNGNTVIDGRGTGNIVTMVSKDVDFKDFKLQNSGASSTAVCIENSSYGNQISNNLIVNCGFGIILTGGTTNNSIYNNTISYEKKFGIYVSSSLSNNITRNKISNIEEMDGIHLSFSHNNFIVDNQVSTSRHGLVLNSSLNNVLNGNTLSNNREYGILLESSGNTTLRNNSMSNNNYNFGLKGDSIPEFTQDVDTSNKVNGKPVYYWVNEHDKTVPTNAGFVAIVNSTNITVSNLGLTKNCYGVVFVNTNNSNIGAVNAFSNELYGIYLFASNKNWLLFNSVSQNLKCAGIGLEYSYNNTISENTVGANNRDGITLKTCNDNKIRDNTIQTNTRYGIWISNSTSNEVSSNIVRESGDSGICLENSKDNVLIKNNCTHTIGKGIQLRSSENNIISSNFITYNLNCGIVLDNSSSNEICLNAIEFGQFVGASLSLSSNNIIYHNDFIGNAISVTIDAESANAWDNDYPSGGNYWDTHPKVDIYSGPYQNETGSDGIIDNRYLINAQNKDRYPLATSIHSLAITNVTVSNTTVERGYPLDINVTVNNPGVSNETFNIIVYCNTTEIQRKTITLAGRNFAKIPFEWDTSNVLKGNYTISAYATPVPGETYTIDNRFTVGIVKVVMAGDLNKDGIVDIFDIVIVAISFGSKPGDSNWNSVADCMHRGESNNIVDIFDLVLVATNFGS